MVVVVVVMEKLSQGAASGRSVRACKWIMQQRAGATQQACLLLVDGA